MEFSLENVPHTFQRVTDVLLLIVKWLHALVNICIVTILLTTSEKHMGHTNEVLQLLMEEGMLFKQKTCLGFSETLDYF